MCADQGRQTDRHVDRHVCTFAAPPSCNAIFRTRRAHMNRMRPHIDVHARTSTCVHVQTMGAIHAHTPRRTWVHMPGWGCDLRSRSAVAAARRLSRGSGCRRRSCTFQNKVAPQARRSVGHTWSILTAILDHTWVIIWLCFTDI